MKARVSIIALDDGGGHRVRMQALQSVLSDFQIDSDLIVAPMDELQQMKVAPGSVVVVDARDIDPSIFLNASFDLTYENRILAIDNLNLNRQSLQEKGVQFFDSLPHYRLDADYLTILDNILFSDDCILESISVMNQPQKSQNHKAALGLPRRHKIVFYAGPVGFLLADMLTFVDQIFTNRHDFEYVRLQSHSLVRQDFLKQLVSADVIITYPGMTFWESILLGAAPVLIETQSDVHDRLSSYLSSKTKFKYVAWNKDLPFEQMLLDGIEQSLFLDLSGWQAWRHKIQSVSGPTSGLKKIATIVREMHNAIR